MLVNKHLPGFLIAASLTTGLSTAQADVSSGASQGYGVSADALVTNIIPATPDASGSAPAPYDTGTLTAVGIGPTSVGLITVSTGVLRASADSDVDGTSGSKTTAAFGQVDSTDITLSSIPFVGTLSLSTGILTSNSSVSGDYGSLMATGSSSVTDLVLEYDPYIGSTQTYTLNLNTAPNTSLLSLLPAGGTLATTLGSLGIAITLNEQFGSCTAGFCSQTTNALRISALTVADITLGHSFAQQAAVVPEASTYGMMLAGLGLVGAMVARRRTI